MKYTIITVNSEGYYSTQMIEATTFTTTPDFITFKKDKNTLMLATDTVISISTEGYDLQDRPRKIDSKKEHNAKILQLVRGRK